MLGAQSAQQLKMDALLFDELKIFATTKEDFQQNTADVPVVMERQVLVAQRVQRTVDVPLVQYIDKIIDVPFVKHEPGSHVRPRTPSAGDGSWLLVTGSSVPLRVALNLDKTLEFSHTDRSRPSDLELWGLLTDQVVRVQKTS